MNLFQTCFDAHVSAICYALSDQYSLPAHSLSTAKRNTITKFVLIQHSQMTDYLRLPIVILTLFFSYAQILIGKKILTQQPLAQRKQTLRQWKRSKIGPLKDLVRFYESLVVLPLYDENSDRAIHAFRS